MLLFVVLRCKGSEYFLFYPMSVLYFSNYLQTFANKLYLFNTSCVRFMPFIPDLAIHLLVKSICIEVS